MMLGLDTVKHCQWMSQRICIDGMEEGEVE